MASAAMDREISQYEPFNGGNEIICMYSAEYNPNACGQVCSKFESCPCGWTFNQIEVLNAKHIVAIKAAYKTVPKDQWIEETEFREYYRVMQLETDKNVVDEQYEKLVKLVEDMNFQYHDAFKRTLEKKYKRKDLLNQWIAAMDTPEAKTKLADYTFRMT